MILAYFAKNVRKITPKAAQEEVEINPTVARNRENAIIKTGL
jgi:hypothetical protein